MLTWFPSKGIEEESKIRRTVQIAQGMIFDDQLNTGPTRHWKQDVERPTKAVGQGLRGRWEDGIGLSGVDDNTLRVPRRSQFDGACNDRARVLAHLGNGGGQIYI